MQRGLGAHVISRVLRPGVFWKKKKVKETKKVNDLNGRQSCLLNLIILDFDFNNRQSCLLNLIILDFDFNNRGNDRIYSIDFVACVQPPLPS